MLIKTVSEIALMREAGKRLAAVYEELIPKVKPGMSTLEVNAIGDDLIRKAGGRPSCLGYEGYPAAFCISVNEVVVHGIPRKDVIIKEGDLVSLDTCLEYKGYNADAARTVKMGNVSPVAGKLVKIAEEAFYKGFEQAKPGNYIRDISKAVQQHVEKNGFGVVRDLTGHGIGTDIHEEPEVPNFHMIGSGMRLRPGMVICVEPMITEGTWRVNWLSDGWTCVTADRKLAAHYENTILITEGEPEILTLSSS